MKCIMCGNTAFDNSEFTTDIINELLGSNQIVCNNIEFTYNNDQISFICPACSQQNLIHKDTFIEQITADSTSTDSTSNESNSSSESDSSSDSSSGGETTQKKKKTTKDSNQAENPDNTTTEGAGGGGAEEATQPSETGAETPTEPSTEESQPAESGTEATPEQPTEESPSSEEVIYPDDSTEDTGLDDAYTGAGGAGGGTPDVKLPGISEIEDLKDDVGSMKDAISSFISSSISGFSTLGLTALDGFSSRISSAMSSMNSLVGAGSGLEKVYNTLKEIIDDVNKTNDDAKELFNDGENGEYEEDESLYDANDTDQTEENFDGDAGDVTADENDLSEGETTTDNDVSSDEDVPEPISEDDAAAIDTAVDDLFNSLNENETEEPNSTEEATDVPEGEVPTEGVQPEENGSNENPEPDVANPNDTPSENSEPTEEANPTETPQEEPGTENENPEPEVADDANPETADEVNPTDEPKEEPGDETSEPEPELAEDANPETADETDPTEEPTEDPGEETPEPTPDVAQELPDPFKEKLNEDVPVVDIVEVGTHTTEDGDVGQNQGYVETENPTYGSMTFSTDTESGNLHFTYYDENGNPTAGDFALPLVATMSSTTGESTNGAVHAGGVTVVTVKEGDNTKQYVVVPVGDRLYRYDVNDVVNGNYEAKPVVSGTAVGGNNKDPRMSYTGDGGANANGDPLVVGGLYVNTGSKTYYNNGNASSDVVFYNATDMSEAGSFSLTDPNTKKTVTNVQGVTYSGQGDYFYITSSNTSGKNNNIYVAKKVVTGTDEKTGYQTGYFEVISTVPLDDGNQGGAGLKAEGISVTPDGQVAVTFEGAANGYVAYLDKDKLLGNDGNNGGTSNI